MANESSRIWKTRERKEQYLADLLSASADGAYALPPLTRAERASRAKVAISKRFTANSRRFSTSFSRTMWVLGWMNSTRRS